MANALMIFGETGTRTNYSTTPKIKLQNGNGAQKKPVMGSITGFQN